LELAEIAEELNIAQRQKEQLLASEQEARKNAESSNRMKDEFISTISHEIRTPLNAIAGWANILKSGNITDATKQKAISTINKNIKTQSSIIDELLLFSTLSNKEQALKTDRIKISNVVETVVDEVSRSAQSKNIKLLKDNRLNGDVVECDEKKLGIAIGNLLENAIKFTPKGGEVKFTAVHKGDKINFKIKDSGKGIDKKLIPYIFDKFWQADSSTTRKFGGLGLGLAISQQIIKLHGGDIKVSSDGENKGTEFDITLPKEIK
jgi:signal transduction histidine kinase